MALKKDKKQVQSQASDIAEVHARLRALQGPETTKYLERMRKKYAKYHTSTSLEEVQDILDRALGERSILDVLAEVRGNY